MAIFMGPTLCPTDMKMQSCKCLPHVSKMSTLTYNREDSVIMKSTPIFNFTHNEFNLALSNHFLSSLECEQSCTCICVFWGGGGEDINLANVSTIFRLDFEIVL
jgi:hypothetical protein